MAHFHDSAHKAFLASPYNVTNNVPFSRGQRVKLDITNDPTGQSVTQAVAADGANFIGWVTEDVAVNNINESSSSTAAISVEVDLRNKPGTHFVQTSGAIAAGTSILPDNAGQVKAGAAGNGATIGMVAYEAALEAGDIIEAGPGGPATL